MVIHWYQNKKYYNTLTLRKNFENAISMPSQHKTVRKRKRHVTLPKAVSGTEMIRILEERKQQNEREEELKEQRKLEREMKRKLKEE